MPKGPHAQPKKYGYRHKRGAVMPNPANAQPRENSPFTPGHPAPPEIFTGRGEEIERLRRSLLQTAGGKAQAFFIGGPRGLGKSSLARFCQFIVEQENALVPTEVRFMCAYNACGKCRNTVDVCRLVVQNLTAALTEESRLEKARKVLGRYVDDISVPLPGIRVSVRLKPDARDLEDLPLSMPTVVGDLWRLVEDRKKGLLIVLDDINGLSAQAHFAAFLKSLWEDIAAERVPVFLLLVGLEERMHELVQAHESVERIFERIVLEPMSREDAIQFFKAAFESVALAISASAASCLAEHSGGYPVMMHELGDATYWENTDDAVDLADAINGLVEATTRVGEKYFSPQVYEAVQSRTFRQILFHTVGKTMFPGDILRGELLESLPTKESRNVDNFFQRMVGLGIMQRVSPGVYRYAYPMFPVYLRMERSKQEAGQP